MTPEDYQELRDWVWERTGKTWTGTVKLKNGGEMRPSEYLELPYTYCLIWDRESKTWTGTIKELPGCIAQGYTEDIIDKLSIALEDWIEAAQNLGQEIPEPEVK